MQEITYVPSYHDTPSELTTPSSKLILIRVDIITFTLVGNFDQNLLFAFKSKALGEYFDLRPNLLVVNAQLVHLQPIKTQDVFGKELRLELIDGEIIILNERDEIHTLSRLVDKSTKGEVHVTAHTLWGTSDKGFLSKIKMTKCFAEQIDAFADGKQHQRVLQRFWLDHRIAMGKTNITSNFRKPFTVHGEFLAFIAAPNLDGTVTFDLIDDRATSQG